MSLYFLTPPSLSYTIWHLHHCLNPADTSITTLRHLTTPSLSYPIWYLYYSQTQADISINVLPQMTPPLLCYPIWHLQHYLTPSVISIIVLPQLTLLSLPYPIWHLHHCLTPSNISITVLLHLTSPLLSYPIWHLHHCITPSNTSITVLLHRTSPSLPYSIWHLHYCLTPSDTSITALLHRTPPYSLITTDISMTPIHRTEEVFSSNKYTRVRHWEVVTVMQSSPLVVTLLVDRKEFLVLSKVVYRDLYPILQLLRHWPCKCYLIYYASPVEICAVSKVSKKDIGRVFKLILKTLETSVDLITTGDFMVS